MTPDTGVPLNRGAPPVGTTAGWVGLGTEPPSNPAGSVARGGSAAQASNLQGAAQSILSISNELVYPNPFNPFIQNTTISFELSEPADVEIVAYDWTGEYVDTVFRGGGSVGVNSVDWGGQTEDGRKLGNGTYMIRVVARTQARSEAVVLKSVVWNDG
jgi:flagellar hook assembly protein FlgD